MRGTQTLVRRVAVDLSKIQEADDGDTTHYGGFWKAGAEEGRGRGSDRDNGFLDDLLLSVAKQLEVTEEELEDAIDQPGVALYAGGVYEFEKWLTDGTTKVTVKELEGDSL